MRRRPACGTLVRKRADCPSWVQNLTRYQIPGRRNQGGDIDGAFDNAEVPYAAMNATPDHSHAMFETHATIATWNSDKLNLAHGHLTRGLRCARPV